MKNLEGWSVEYDEKGKPKAVRSQYGWPTAKIALAALTECECDGPIICGWCLRGCPTDKEK